MSLVLDTGTMKYRENPNQPWRPLVIKAGMNWESMADTYDPDNGTYEVGQYVLEEGMMYRCIYEITTPEAWMPAHWTSVNVGDELSSFIIISDDQPTDETNKIWITETTTPFGVQVPTMDDHIALGNTLDQLDANQKTFVRPNLLDNWYFGNPVNQRGQNSYSNTGYTIDRWKLTSGSLTVVTGGFTLNGTVVQILENAIGQTVTASALLSDGTMVTPTYDDSTKTFTITVSNKTVVAAKLEIGSTQTLAHLEGSTWVLNEIPNYDEEFAKCQRYFIAKIFALLNPSSKSGNMQYYQCGCNFPVPMRAVPSSLTASILEFLGIPGILNPTINQWFIEANGINGVRIDDTSITARNWVIVIKDISADL